MNYDCRNRLIQARGTTYTYDAENNRIQAETDEKVEVYVTDTASSSLSRILTMTVYEKEASGFSDTGVTTLYVYGQGLISQETGGFALYHHYNHLGSTMKLTNAEGEVTASYTYGTYGELLSGNASFTRFLYNGRCGVSTDENGLYYMRQRYYNPEIKRFVNQDILTGSPENSQSLNRYSYVQGNPVSYTDPFGLSPLKGLFSGTNLVHAVPGLLSCVPGPVGAIASLADAGVYFFVDKDYGMAALSALNALSFGLGKAAGFAARSYGLTRTAQVLQTTSNLMSRASSFGMNAMSAMRTGYDMYDKYVIQGQQVDLLSTGAEALQLGMSIFGCVISAREMHTETKKLGEMFSDVGFTNGLKEEICGFAGGMKGSLIPLNNRGCVDFGWRSESSSSLLLKAENARDDLIINTADGRKKSMVIGAYDIKTGDIAADFAGTIPENISPILIERANKIGGIGSTGLTDRNTIGVCAEFRTANQLLLNGSDISNIRFTKPIRPRTGEVRPNCSNCLEMFYDILDK